MCRTEEDRIRKEIHILKSFMVRELGTYLWCGFPFIPAKVTSPCDFTEHTEGELQPRRDEIIIGEDSIVTVVLNMPL